LVDLFFLGLNRVVEFLADDLEKSDEKLSGVVLVVVLEEVVLFSHYSFDIRGVKSTIRLPHRSDELREEI